MSPVIAAALHVAALAGPLAPIAVTAEPLESGLPLTVVLERYRADGWELIYNNQLVTSAMRVKSFPEAENPLRALELVLADHGLTLQRVAGRTFLVVPARGSPVAAGRIWGIVRSSESRRPLAGALVRLDPSGAQTTTSRDGQFILTGLRAGRYQVAISAEGHDPQRIEGIAVTDRRPGVVLGELATTGLNLQTVVVTASRYALERDSSPSRLRLGRSRIEDEPQLGEDALRAVQRLPGVASGGVSARVNVRGGEQNEVLILYDGMPLYEPFHLKDFQSVFSVLDPNVVGGIDFYSGGYPAQYGDRMSAVIDIAPLRPQTDRSHKLGLSFFNATAFSSGLFGAGRGEWLASVRRGTLDLLVDLADPEAGTPEYLDTLGRVGYDFGILGSLTLTGMWSEDDIEVDAAERSELATSEHRNSHLWLTHDKDWSDTLRSRTLLYRAFLDAERSGDIDDPATNRGTVEDARRHEILGIKQDWSYDRSDAFILRWGAEARQVSAEYEFDSTAEFFNGINEPFGRPPTIARSAELSVDGQQYAAYVTARARLGSAWTAEAGLRWDRQTYTARDGDEQLGPRLALLYEIGARTRLRASWGHYWQSQGINELQIEDGVRRFFAAQRSTHTILSLEREFGRSYQLRLEAFRKRISDLRPRFENLIDPLVLMPELEPDRLRIAPEEAEVRGLELMLAQDRGPGVFDWWLSYSRSSVDDRVAGQTVPRNWDQQDAASFGLSWTPGAWRLSAAGSYNSGWPTTELRAETVVGPGGSTSTEFVIGPRNAERLDDFLAIDLRASRSFELGMGSLLVYLEITNALNRQNACCVDFSVIQHTDGSLELQQEVDTWLPLLPSLGVEWRF